MAKPTAIPAVGTVSGLARKESIYDTDGFAAGAPPTQIILFNNFGAFAGAGLIAKQFGRDTNLQGGQGGLPQAHQALIYKWRMKLQHYETDLSAPANAATFANDIWYQQISFSTFQLAQTRYITEQLSDLVSFTDSLYTNTLPSINANLPAAAVVIVTRAVGNRDGKDITVKGEPKVLQPLEQFQIIVGTPAAAGMVAVENTYVTAHLDGILARGVTG